MESCHDMLIQTLRITRVGKFLLIVWAMLVGSDSAVPEDPDWDTLPALVTADGESLEPSGLVWAHDLGVAIAVNDERLEAPGYEIFAFDPSKVSQRNTIIARPLVSLDDSQKFQFDDLEGLTRLDSGEFFAIGSLSLDAPPKNPNEEPEDRWSRHQAARFRIRRDDAGNLQLTNLNRVSANARPDLREWLISSSGRSWQDEAYRKRAERGGINVEGLASTRNGELVIGFREPLQENYNVPVLFVQPRGPDKAPGVPYWKHIDLSGIEGTPEEKQRGIRGIERIPGSDEPERFLVVLGPVAGRFDAHRLAIWEPRSGTLKDRGAFSSTRFVAEGAAVVEELDNGMLKVLVVSDKAGRVLFRTIPR